MTTLVFIFTHSFAAIFGAGVMGVLAGGSIADLRAENAELREAAALDRDIAKLKAIIEEPEEDEAA
jgi:hypothetical protein